ncbi:MAG TPA: LysR family transcriptional regulator [Pseudonocardiaceae bacterium]|nr:LysR family transcriptional regulator [Pseudonocardiaceae bacterium]
MTLTQLSAFVLVARLGSVSAAAHALDVSEPAVSQALAALRKHFGDPLLVRGANGMTLTAGGGRLLSIAAQMVALGADAEAGVRAARGAPEQLRVVADSPLAEFVAPPLVEAFAVRSGHRIETMAGVAATGEMPVLVGNRLADLAIGPNLAGDNTPELFSQPLFRARLVVVVAGTERAHRNPAHLPWLVDSSGTDPDSDTGRLLRALRVDEERLMVFPNQTAAWAAAADGAGAAPAIEHLVANRVRRGELRIVETPVTPFAAPWYITGPPAGRRSASADSFVHFLGTPAAMRIMREPGAGVPPSRFRPPVYVTLWH